ncbi:glycoside hydrolase family 71 protein [Aspergillus neoniger CBS 115656]|uniref:Extracellular alpha-1,3-glucanase/mutanase n=1 Tax=Aspergillus neoniger (strain CBS 115656) TaxID=1448310 RepID=A0A318YLP3_ASPNB|nr:extracellular alpha-1,3-glucanase/mutanase [Aspergillus neoniger CBS 115656]PYH35104.1 extracellular alpha-1,3-glucanase/mutanase [Aspergillus neoniger CBS 115656]
MMRFLFIALFGLLWAKQALGAAVFAHFIVGNAWNYTLSDWEDDMTLAQEAHIDAFALNMGYGDSSTATQAALAFEAAKKVDFKLFFSFDYEGGTGAWPESDILTYLNKYASNSAHYKYNGKAFVSTFEGTAYATDWKSIKSQVDCFFVPDWSSLGAEGAYEAGGGGIVDGLFSWGAWPSGPNNMSNATDLSYLDLDIPYMMPASPWFYTNLASYSKNWLWRGDSLWHDRWEQIWDLQPEWVEILTWNDYGESHYIGPIREDAISLMTTGGAPLNYIENMPHDGWRDLLPFAIDTYVKGNATLGDEGIVTWYRPNPSESCGTGGTTGNTASEGQTLYPPAEVAENKIFYSAMLHSHANVSVTVGGTSLGATWAKHGRNSGAGLYHGAVEYGSATGKVVVSITRDGETLASVAGQSINATCVSDLSNWNAWVGSSVAKKTNSRRDATLPVKSRHAHRHVGRGHNRFH